MVNDLEELTVLLAHPHERDERKVYQKDAEADWEQQQGLKILRYCQVHEKARNDPHDRVLPVEMDETHALPRGAEEVAYSDKFVLQLGSSCSGKRCLEAVLCFGSL